MNSFAQSRAHRTQHPARSVRTVAAPAQVRACWDVMGRGGKHMRLPDTGFARRTDFYVGLIVLLALAIGVAVVLRFFFW